jgi:hypothetical protein
MEFVTDEHVGAVLEFIQKNVPTNKLCGVAETAAQIGKLLWAKYPQEPVIGIAMRGKPLTATGFGPSPVGADDDSAAAVCVPPQ